MRDKKYIECEVCDEKFTGIKAINSYLKQDLHGKYVCVKCLKQKQQATKQSHYFSDEIKKTSYKNELMPDTSGYDGEWLPYRSTNRY